MSDGEVPGRILLVVAHPDDADFGAAGSVASWTASGWDVSYCIITDGSAGSIDPDVDLSTLVATREREQRDAASVVGVTDVTYLGYRDGQLEPTLDVRRDISRVIRQVRPDRVVTQSPERNYERIFASHPDHMAAGEATLRAVYPDARNPFAHPELLEAGFEPFAVPEVWMMASSHADRCVDTTDFFDKKLAAIAAHKSQVVPGPDLEKRMLQWQRATAERHGLPEGRLAEAFQVIQTG